MRELVMTFIYFTGIWAARYAESIHLKRSQHLKSCCLRSANINSFKSARVFQGKPKVVFLLTNVSR